MAQILIDIDDKTYKAFMELISINLGRSNYKGIIGKCLGAIKHGKVLPKGHGRLIDADAFERRCMFDSNIEDMQDVIYALRDYKPIIEADKEEA